MAHFFWGNLGDVHKYHLAHWGLVTRKEIFGGLGVPNLRDINLALLASWSKRYYDGTEKGWKLIIHHKYLHNKSNLFHVRSNVGSPFWKGLTWALSFAKCFYKWKVGDGRNIDFWSDIW